ncbi:MAG: 6,7-dimethyl-8-ribityllumazine synthase [Actinomycetota bacterium]|nr:6,7-dimethyl-8-ribityllumazine synthase [Actinomycetota bacterium]
MAVYEGHLVATGLRFAVVVSRFNEFISTRLLDGALDALKRHDADMDGVDVVWVPGSFEIPLAASRLARTGKYDAVICLGAVIRGSTPHFEYVAAEVSKGIARVNLDSGVPTVFGVITADTIEQAVERAGAKQGNKGWQAALTAVEMGNLLKSMGSAPDMGHITPRPME